METFTIDLVHTASDEHVLTAYDAQGSPICSLIDGDDGWEVAEPVEGERLETLGEVQCDLKVNVGKLHGKMYQLSDSIDSEE